MATSFGPFEPERVFDINKHFNKVTGRLLFSFVLQAAVILLYYKDADNPSVSASALFALVCALYMTIGMHIVSSERKLNKALTEVQCGVVVDIHKKLPQLLMSGYTSANVWQCTWREVPPDVWKSAELDQIIDFTKQTV